MHTVVHKEAALQREVLHVAAEVEQRHRTRRKLRARRRHASIHIRHVTNLNTDRAIAFAGQRLAKQSAHEACLALSLEPHHVHTQSQVGAQLQRRHPHDVHHRVQRSFIAQGRFQIVRHVSDAKARCEHPLPERSTHAL